MRKNAFEKYGCLNARMVLFVLRSLSARKKSGVFAAAILFSVFAVVFLPSCVRQAESKTEVVMGTICTIKLYGRGRAKLYEKIFSRLHEIDNAFSTTIGTSEISAINKAAGDHSVAVSRDVFFVVKAALYFAKLSDGAFDPTIGPLVNLWGINTEGAHIPSETEIAEVLPLVNWRNVRIAESGSPHADLETDGAAALAVTSRARIAIDEHEIADCENANKIADEKKASETASGKNAGTVMLLKKGMALDLGGIAKGFAADEIVRILREEKVFRAIVDLGGNVFVFGKKNKGAFWKVGVKNPNDARGEPIAVLHTSETSVVTSGVYERFFIANGIRYHHILDPKTGFPARTGLLSTTIICRSSLASDALSTAVFVLGKNRGEQLLKKIFAEKNPYAKFLPVENLRTPLSSIFIDESETLFASRALEGNIETDDRKIVFE